MAARTNPRMQIGSAAWINDERSSAMQIAEAEIEEFGFSARNEVEWLNEHMADIFSKNQVNVADVFKTPGKLRGKTPRTARKANALEGREPLSDIFSATPQGAPSPFRQIAFEKPVPTFQVAEDDPSSCEVAPSLNTYHPDSQYAQKLGPNHFDSGYFGSQFATQSTQATQPFESLLEPPQQNEWHNAKGDAGQLNDDISEMRRSTEESFQSAKEEQTRNFTEEPSQQPERTDSPDLKEATRPVLESPLQSRLHMSPSPQKRSPLRLAQADQSPAKSIYEADEAALANEKEPVDDIHSQSDGSSPIRPIVRKGSLNFASLPAREPITTKKSIGNRLSRTSQLDQSRSSYYGRQTGGKSLGNNTQDEDDDDTETDHKSNRKDSISLLHNKTSTQRLQDQISMLGKSQTGARPASKSLANNVTMPLAPSQPAQDAAPETLRPKSPLRIPVVQRQSPQRKEFTAPGAFPDEEDDSWIGPPNATSGGPSIFSPRPQLLKSRSTDVMEDIRGKDSIGGSEFSFPKRGVSPRQRSPLREDPVIPERTTSHLGHKKSVSTSELRSPTKPVDAPGHKKAISVSNPNPSVESQDLGSPTMFRSPSRSPLKAAKDKFSSILKTSRGLFASSAAVSAEAKTSTMSPGLSQVAMAAQQSLQDLAQIQTAAQDKDRRLPMSPGKASIRKTRSSSEREERRKEEEAREIRASKEAQRVAEQLEKARQKVKDEARIYHLEQERVAAMQKEVSARQDQAKANQADPVRTARSSPRKVKAQSEAEDVAATAAVKPDLTSRDVEMTDASSTMAPPARPKSQIGRPQAKRPLKPAKESATKSRPPTVIRVDIQRGHPYHPSNSTIAATLQESLAAPTQSGPSQGQLSKKTSTSSIQSKASSTSSFKSAASKALEAAARKKELDELAIQRKKDAKQELERQRATIKEEERRKEEQQRRKEQDRQRAIQKEKEQAASVADAKKSASRQAIEKRRMEVEKAKQTGAPPPAIRPPPNGESNLSHAEKPLPSLPPQRPESAAAKPAPRINSTMHRAQDDAGKTTGSILHTAKVPPKRPLPDNGDDHHSRPQLQRNPPSYHHGESQPKRRRTSDNFDEDDDMTEPHNNIKAPPIRQSSNRQKDAPTKSIFPFPAGYTAVQPPNLQRNAVLSQHNANQSKPAHPMDLTQVSKGTISFAAGSSQAGAQHKTPARPGAQGNIGKSAGKSGAKSSPRYQNGESIDLPEIHTDSEDEDSDDDKAAFMAAWTNSPDLRKQLAKQEGLDPAEVFGQPGPLNMEEVFSKSKDRWHKFRQRTSSANWSGQDRLTEDEVQKDLEGRDRVRRQGGWTYDSMV